MVLVFAMGADTGEASAHCLRGRVEIDYDGAKEPIFDQIADGFDALGADTGLRVSAWRKPLTNGPLACGGRLAEHRGCDHVECGCLASAALTGAPQENNKVGDAERLFNGRMIAALRALSDASGLPSDSRQSQCDVVLVAAALAGLALLARSGRLEALGFTPDEMIARLDGRFRSA